MWLYVTSPWFRGDLIDEMKNERFLCQTMTDDLPYLSATATVSATNGPNEQLLELFATTLLRSRGVQSRLAASCCTCRTTTNKMQSETANFAPVPPAGELDET